jgi:thiol:disulfide interchange protein DsbC
MNYISSLSKLLLLCLISFNTAASDDKIVTDAVGVLSKKIQQPLSITKITPSKIAGLSQVNLDTKIIYISDDGKYAILGNVLDLDKESSNWNLTEQESNKARSAILAEIKFQQPIVYKAQNKKIGEVVVFTDVDCGYCKKMHKQVNEYTALGIEVIFMAYPSNRSGNNQTFIKTQSIWCSADPLASLDSVASYGRNIETKSCDSPVPAHLKLGQRLGVTGTPALFLTDGRLLPGYVTPSELAKIIQQNS